MNAAYFLLFGILISGASAHTLYAEFPRELSAGSSAGVWIAYGHGGTAETELISLPVAHLISPGGRVTNLDLEPYSGGLRGRVGLEETGTYTLDLQSETSLFDPSWFGASGDRTLIEKYSRALLPVQSGHGFGWSSGKGLEIVSETDPYLLKKGDEFQARALWNGKPIGGSYSATVARLPDDVLMVQHAQETVVEGISDLGDIGFKLDAPGLWILSFEATLDEDGMWKATSDDAQGHYHSGDDLDYKKRAPTAYLSFWVGN
ncbi:MAG TPA: DUF4198 domain-containing protein [Methanotrichaceae archaeon]|nr:MAG: Nickel uptake substrate-specific transmembrane region [Methanosaeta sp. PtaU1.Bin028]HOT07713.1 DUF4198 domain-containing protein [Methanotrichaceae archaeon]HQF17583.1 DUF4198 domain-containing protein [Methanotrichaceae archaeon]HQI92162.1 DUF4198 domain-containing protein [Methanotrichaceae archaeon]